MPPPVIKTLSGPQSAVRLAPWLAAAAGTTVALVGVNAWTGGALLAPALGPAVSSVLGGSWLGLSAMTPVGAQSAFQTTSLIAVGIAGGLFGHWLGSR